MVSVTVSPAEAEDSETEHERPGICPDGLASSVIPKPLAKPAKQLICTVPAKFRMPLIVNGTVTEPPFAKVAEVVVGVRAKSGSAGGTAFVGEANSFSKLYASGLPNPVARS